MAHEGADVSSHLLIATTPATSHPLEDTAEESIHPLTAMSDAGSTSTNCQGDDAKKDFEMAIEDGPQQNRKKYVMVFVWHNSKTSILISERIERRHCPCSFKLAAVIFLGTLVLSCIIGISMWQVNNLDLD